MQGRAILIVVGILVIGLVLQIRNHFFRNSTPEQTVSQPAKPS